MRDHLYGAAVQLETTSASFYLQPANGEYNDGQITLPPGEELRYQVTQYLGRGVGGVFGAPPVFIAEWYVHGGQMVIESGGRGRISYSSPCGPDNTQRCRDTTRFRYETSSGGQELSATVTETKFLTQSGVDLARMGEYYTAYSVGDTFKLRSVAPHLLKTIRQSGGPSGNPYWCQSGVSKTDGLNCGA